MTVIQNLPAVASLSWIQDFRLSPLVFDPTDPLNPVINFDKFGLAYYPTLVEWKAKYLFMANPSWADQNLIINLVNWTWPLAEEYKEWAEIIIHFINPDPATFTNCKMTVNVTNLDATISSYEFIASWDVATLSVTQETDLTIPTNWTVAIC